MDFALIGNGSFHALIDSQARVQWLCWPRFDSSFVIGSLVDVDKGGTFSIEAVGEDYVATQKYVDDTAIVETTFRRPGEAFTVTDFAPRSHDGRPRQLVRCIVATEGCPRVKVHCAPVYEYGLGTSEDVVLQSSTAIPCGEEVELSEPLYLVLSWKEPVSGDVPRACDLLLVETRQYWHAWVATLRLPPSDYLADVIRSAITLKLHHYEDTGAFAAAATTSIPEHLGSGRNWDYRYCWPRDSYFTVDALHLLGRHQEGDAFVDFLLSVAAHGKPWQPLYGIAGELNIEEQILPHLAGYLGDGPVRIGNLAYAQDQHDIYGEMIAALAPVYKAAPDERRRDLLISLLDAIESNFESPDAGIWEKRTTPAIYTFSLLMHWMGGRCAWQLGMEFIDTELAERGEAIMERAREVIDTKCWNEQEGYYVDTESGRHADAALLFMINAGYLNFRDPRARSHLQGLIARLECADGYVRRYVHDDGLGATHATFTVCTLWYAEALAWVGEFDEAERVLRKVLANANHVGLLSEDIDPKDFSLWGNFPQTYSHVGIIRCVLALAHRSH